jgi:hypothetical protein
MNECLKVFKKKYGNSECFIFSTHPHWKIYPVVSLEEPIIYCETDLVQIGKSSCAIVIYEYCEKGQSNNCSTFNCPQLTKEDIFNIVEIEVLAMI